MTISVEHLLLCPARQIVLAFIGGCRRAISFDSQDDPLGYHLVPILGRLCEAQPCACPGYGHEGNNYKEELLRGDWGSL